MFVHTSLFFSLSQKFRSQRKPLNMLCFVPHHTVNQVGWCWTRKQNSWTKCSFAISSFILAFSENEWSGGWVCWFLAVFVCAPLNSSSNSIFILLPYIFFSLPHSLVISVALCSIFCCGSHGFAIIFFLFAFNIERMCKEKISYILHKFHLVCNAHAHTSVF